MTVDLDRRPFPAERRIVLGGLRSGRRMAIMTALVQVDVSDAMERVKSEDLSPTAFVLASEDLPFEEIVLKPQETERA